MKIKSGKIISLNKKLIATALTFVLAAPLVACDDISIDSIRYIACDEVDSGYSISYENLGYCAIYKVYDNKRNEENYTICFQDLWNESLHIKYYDIFTEEEYKLPYYGIKQVKDLKTYLNEIDMVKEQYGEAELQQALQSFIASQEKAKQLIK